MTVSRFVLRALPIVCLLITAAPAGADPRPGPRGCSLASLRGPYGFSYTGTVVTPPFPAIPAGPFAAAGRIVFNGDGTFSSRLTQSFNGIVLPETVTTGVYALEADCTGIASDSNGGAYAFVLSAKGRQIVFILTNPGVVATGAARFQL